MPKNRHLIRVMSRGVYIPRRGNLKLRVWVGAFLLFLDTISDVYMINVLWNTPGKRNMAIANAVCVAFATLIQIGLVLSWNAKNKKGFSVSLFLFETVTILVGIKPLVDAYRIDTTSELDPLTTLEMLNDIMYFKTVEMGLESIPSAVIQTYAYLEFSSKISRQNRPAQIASIAISMLTTAFASTSMSVDSDMHPIKRRLAPKFHGYIPDAPARRVLTVVCMYTMACSHVALKTVSTALCAALDERLVVLYALSDVALHMAVKAAVGDLTFFINVRGPMNYVFTPMARLVTKLVSDFTGLLHFRHPFVLGGLIWTVNLVWSQVMAFAVTWAYMSYTPDDAAGKVKGRDIWPLLIALQVVYLVSFTTFIFSINRSFVKTFFDTTTARGFYVNWYKDTEDEKDKALVFDVHPVLYKDFEEDIFAYFLEHLPVWEAEKPDWWVAMRGEVMQKMPMSMRKNLQTAQKHIDRTVLPHQRLCIEVGERAAEAAANAAETEARLLGVLQMLTSEKEALEAELRREMNRRAAEEEEAAGKCGNKTSDCDGGDGGDDDVDDGDDNDDDVKSKLDKKTD